MGSPKNFIFIANAWLGDRSPLFHSYWVAELNLNISLAVSLMVTSPVCCAYTPSFLLPHHASVHSFVVSDFINLVIPRRSWEQGQFSGFAEKCLPQRWPWYTGRWGRGTGLGRSIC